MSYRLSIYSQKGFKEYLLPAIDNSDYSIVIGSEMFGLRRDIELPLEILDGKWRINHMPGTKIDYVQRGNGEGGDKYDNEYLRDNDILLIEISEGSKVSVVVKESSEYFSIYKKYVIMEGSSFSIGRDSSNTFCYSNLGLVSGTHASIYRRDNQTIIEDKSSNGTFINGRRIEGDIALNEGDCIDIFGLRILYFNPFIAVGTHIENLTINEDALDEFESIIIESPYIFRLPSIACITPSFINI